MMINAICNQFVHIVVSAVHCFNPEPGVTTLGAPVALCIIRSKDARSGTVKLRNMEGMSAAFWTANGYEHLLIGGTDKALIGSVAEQMMKVLWG